MHSPFTLGSTSSSGTGTGPQNLRPPTSAEEGQGMLNLSDEAPLLSLLDPAARVMSPNTGATSVGSDIELLPQGVISQVRREGIVPALQCQVCGGVEMQLYVCSGCYKMGHFRCLTATMVGGYAFCNNCAADAITTYGQ